MSTEDEQKIEGAENEEQQQQPGEERPAGQVEGGAPEASTDDVQAMYDDLGIKTKAPSGKSKGRPKTPDSGDKKTAKQDDASGESEKGRKADDSKKQSKTPPASDSDGSDGDDADSKSKKSSQKAGKDAEEDSEVSKSDGEDAEGVRKTQSNDNEKAAKTGEEDDEEGNSGTGQEEHEQESEDEKGSKSGSEEEQGKRPGKSNPAVEKRMQQLASDRKEALERAEAAEKKLQEATRAQEQDKIKQEDPEYTIDDFRKVRDNNTGEIKELSRDEAELYWRRWKDGYNQRAEERQAKENHEAARAEREEATTRQLMQDSADAYDALAALQDEYPELVQSSDKFDPDFAAEAMPIVNEAIQYAPGTEPGNESGQTSIVVGLKVHPGRILKALKSISEKKRTLPLNGVNDSVETRSNVNVPHSRSSDPSVNAANELYKELGIKKRI